MCLSPAAGTPLGNGTNLAHSLLWHLISSILPNVSSLLHHHNRSRNSPGLTMRRTFCSQILSSTGPSPDSCIWAREYKYWKEISWTCIRDTVIAGQRCHGSEFRLTELNSTVTSIPMPAESKGYRLLEVWLRPSVNPRPKTLASQSYMLHLPKCFFLSSTSQITTHQY